MCSDSSESSESSGGPRSAHNDKVRPARPGWGWMLLSLDFRILTNEVDKASVRKLERVSCFFPNAWCFFSEIFGELSLFDHQKNQLVNGYRMGDPELPGWSSITSTSSGTCSSQGPVPKS